MFPARNKYFSITCYVLSLYTFWVMLHAYAEEDKKEYIVYMGALPEDDDYIPSSHHLSMLGKVLVGRVPEESLVKSYGKSFNGFAAKLSEQEKVALSNLDEVVSVFPSKQVKLLTTRSWDFSGFPVDVYRHKPVESDIIIGFIDTGIWPQSKSFSDEGLGPIPKKWKGQCDVKDFKCNKKIIGARVYENVASPLDSDNHGTHVASIAAGNIVKDANINGVANGTARGAVPSARIAVYKLTATGLADGKLDTMLLAAFDDAIKDGVDILSVSLGPADGIESFDTDAVSIGSFHALVKGIMTVQAAGNFGKPASVASLAPWILTVGSSTTDRKLISKLIVDKNMEFTANNGLNIFGTGEQEVPLIRGKAASNSCNKTMAGFCFTDCLDPTLVKGKIVMCNIGAGVFEATRAGALGVVFPEPGEKPSSPQILPLPSIELNKDDYIKLVSHVQTSKSTHGRITKMVSFNDSTAPLPASHSSRGPNPVAFDILKPDITAPGVSILAANSPIADPFLKDVKYTLETGTSMATPHVSGAAAYVKTFHPSWTPSAIKSAIMTTSRSMNHSRDPGAEFAYGSGFFDLVKARDPGLVYDAKVDDYLHFLCKLGYDVKKIKLIGGVQTSCPVNSANQGSPQDVNIPSLSVEVKENKPFMFKFMRTVTNVGNAASTYKATIEGAPNSTLEVHVSPSTLEFKSLNEKKSFSVTVTSKRGLKKGNIISKQLIWKSSDGHHHVRSPIVVYNYPDRHTT